ncbi:hypothetical protein [Chania multitudinisentens]|uniref:hypothetical protein n=1 Tax=Chania multitudinisentens TaxID=1639108 RepID=UPI000466EDB9|nr:hypothetical protein [Chania multitudinisentens]
MNIPSAFRKLLVPTIFLLSGFVVLPSQAEENKDQRYLCNGTYGNAIDSGVWDGVFNAANENDAANQARAKFMPTGSGAWIKVFICRKL